MPDQHVRHHQYPTGRGSVAVARRDCRQALRTWGIPADQKRAQDVVLLVSELMTNAVTHGFVSGRLVALTLENADGTIRISVRDTRTESAVKPRNVSADAESGRGLLIVENLADDWGVKREVVGKTVWAEIKSCSA